MIVIATAGHVDHGKSTLVRALTGMEPDRWAQERVRGMTIDLGYAWTTPAKGPTLAFVDVPGHERFIGNMLAGLGPAPAVMMVVSADEGWRAQSAEHLAAIDALQLRHGLLVITRSDLADPGPAANQAQHLLAASSLGAVRAVPVSARTGAGLDDVRSALAELADRLPAPQVDGRIRFWVDRAFRIRGAGTVVTGTLAAGSLAVDDTLEYAGNRVRIRGLQSLGVATERVEAVSRVAINLRGAGLDRIHRGTPLVTPGGWSPTTEFDARTSVGTERLPAAAVLHLGAGAFPVRIRPLGDRIARITLAAALPLQPGDRGILRNPGLGRLEGSVQVLDVAPPVLSRRGAAARRGEHLATTELPTLTAQVERRGAARRGDLRRLGLDVDDLAEVRREGEWLISPARWRWWRQRLEVLLTANDLAHPLQPGMTTEAARKALEIPDSGLLLLLLAESGLQVRGGRVQRRGSLPSLGPSDRSVAELVKTLQLSPFAAPERPDLQRLGLGRAELAAAEQAGRLLRLADDVVLLPDAPARAMAVLVGLPQPFTTSAARAALGTTRRVAVPLLEHLDSVGHTRQLQPGSRIVTPVRDPQRHGHLNA